MLKSEEAKRVRIERSCSTTPGNENYGTFQNGDVENGDLDDEIDDQPIERSDIFHDIAFHRVQSVYTLLRRKESVGVPPPPFEASRNFRSFSFHIDRDASVAITEFLPDEQLSKKSLTRKPQSSISAREKPSQDRKGGTLLAGWSVINLIQGVGILGVPYAVTEGGWAAFVCIFVVAWMCSYTGKLLIECMYETSPKTGYRRRLRVNYPEVGEACFGKVGQKLVATVQTIEMLGASVLYVVLLGTVWNDLLGQRTGLGVYEWAAINCLIALPSLFITRMSILSWLSMVSVFALMSSLFAITIFSMTKYSAWRLDHIAGFDPKKFPIGFGIIVFSYCAHAVFPSVEGSMRKPEKFGQMMNYSFTLAAFVKFIMSIVVVLTFGQNTEQVCTVNLRENLLVSLPVSVLVILSVLLAVPLCMFVVSSLFDEIFLKYFPYLKPNTGYHWVWLLISRPLLINVALLLGIIIPHFGLLMGLVGSLTGTCLCFVFPCVFHIKLRWKTMPLTQKIKDILIIAFGAVAGTLGLWFSGAEVAKKFKL